MARRVLPPLRPGWVIVDDRPMFHRWCRDAPEAAGTVVHVHGFGISGTYLEPTAALLAARHPTFVPDLPGMGRSLRPEQPLDLPGLARALVEYCDVVGVERATFVGNSLGCPIIVELATRYPERIDRVVLVSPAGGPNNLPLRRALGQMAKDSYREPPSMVPIAARDYLRFGVLRSWLLFRAMNSYDTLGALPSLVMPTLVIAGDRDPLVRIDRVGVFAGLPHVEAVTVDGAHALNFSRPEVVAALVEAHMAGRSLTELTGPGSRIVVVPIGARPADGSR